VLILGIETSCDETAAAVVRDGAEVLSSIIATSKGNFERSGGVIPEEAARRQVECMLPVLDQALSDAKVSAENIDAIAVTKGPGLLGSLLVGTTTARAIASVWEKRLIGVHHTLGHLSSTWLRVANSQFSILNSQFPILTLSASGGHTELWLRESHTKGVLLGRTRDDAAGEAFDKGAKLLGLPYPGGPAISKAGSNGDAEVFAFPLPLHSEETFDFSFSGLKTALRYTIRDNQLTADNLPPTALSNLAASFERAICAHLLDRIGKALSAYPQVKEVHIVGGVSANIRLRTMATELCKKYSVELRVPVEFQYCTDNAAMIASAAYFLHQEKGDDVFAPFTTEASLPLENLSW
jgi:N6-L-threonylcarbamoyladenine synthase